MEQDTSQDIPDAVKQAVEPEKYSVMKTIRKYTSPLVVLAGLSIGLYGCTTTQRAAGWGAAVGGLTGAVIGNQSGRAGEGAALGALIGGAVGTVFDDTVNTVVDSVSGDIKDLTEDE